MNQTRLSRPTARLMASAPPSTDEVRDRGLTTRCVDQGGLDRFDRLREDVPDQEQDHARGARRQDGLRSGREIAQTPDGQPEEDGRTGDRGQEDGLFEGHGCHSYGQVGRGEV